jgi:serine/threonine-protein kinase
MQKGDVLRGKYRLLRLLGDGGMGSVYEAHHEGLGTRVAIKVLHSDLARRTGLVERFLREARVSAQIKSPNVVQVMDVDSTEEGAAYIVMELLEGEPLSGVLEREGKLPVDVSIDYTSQILRALEAAHALSVVHRDLKPENVFVTVASGKALLKLIDFGIAKARQTDSESKNLTVAGIVMGTPEYMAPEQARAADKVDARSDIYAVGVMLYEMISGSRPATGDDARLVALKVESGDIRPLVHAAPGVPPDLAGLVHRAMAARPELRFATASEMRVALDAMAGKRASAASLAPVPMQPSPVVDGRPSAAPGQGTTTTPAGPPNFSSAPPPPQAAGYSASPQAPASGYAPAPRTTVVTDPMGEGPPAAHDAPYTAGAYGQTPNAMGAPPYARYGPRSAPGVRPRVKKGMSAAWLLIGVPIVLGAAIVLAFAIAGSGGPASPPPAKPPSTATPVTIAPTQTTPPPPTTPATPDTVAPLTPAGPVPHTPATGPGSTKPRPSASASASASAAPSASAPDPTSPFPFPSLPSIPNPFPSPSTSGVGPVITIPSFPFPFPGAPSSAPPPAPAPAHPGPSTSGGKAI